MRYIGTEIVAPAMLDRLKQVLLVTVASTSLVGLAVGQTQASVSISEINIAVQSVPLGQGEPLPPAQDFTQTGAAATQSVRRPSGLQTLGIWLMFAGLPVAAIGVAWYAFRRPLWSPSPPASAEPIQNTAETALKLTEVNSPESTTQSGLAQTTPTTSLVSTTTRLEKVDIVETLVADLQHPDRTKRCQAIWELGQRGDSRAVQPLTDVLVTADSQQRSLILAAIAEISVRTLKPVHRALVLSLQDESADVRKNAIRDTTRIYDSMIQVSQLLQYAMHDADAEVQETAHWALEQLHRLRTVPEVESAHRIEPASGQQNAVESTLDSGQQ